MVTSEDFQQLQGRCTNLLERRKRLFEKLAFFEEEYDKKTNAEVRFELKNGIRGIKAELYEVEAEIGIIETRLGECKQQIEKIERTRKREVLHACLLRLDFEAQEKLFKKLLYWSSLGAFLIHGEPGYGQSWLLNRLIRHIPRFTVGGKTIRLNVQLTGGTPSIGGLLEQFSLRGDLKNVHSWQEVIDQFHDWWQTRTVVLILHNVNVMDTKFVKEFIEFFWLPLVDKATNVPSSEPYYKLIAFLIDNRGRADGWSLHTTEQVDEASVPRKPVKPPKLTPILSNELMGWLMGEEGNLPLKLRVEDILRYNQDGVPETVLEDICNLCGLDWDESEQLWIIY